MEYGYLILLAFAVLMFGLLTLLRKWIDSFILIAFAIGSVVGAGIYQGIDVPVKIGPFVFSISIILYVVFYYCILVKYIHYGKQSTKIMVLSSLVAVIISAFVEFFAYLSSKGYSWEIMGRLLYYLMITFFNFLFVLLSLWLMHIFEKKKVNRLISIGVCLIASGVLCSGMYYSIGLIFVPNVDTFLPYFASSIVGKLICTILALISYWINSRFWIPNEIKRIEQSKND